MKNEYSFGKSNWITEREIDNIFDSSKFKKRFPEFKVTTYEEGIKAILNAYVA